MRPSLLAWTLNDDGSFDLQCPAATLRHCFPTVDHEPLRPVGVDIEHRHDTGGGTITYELSGGRALRLVLDRDEDGLTLESALLGWPQAPHWLHPLASGIVEGRPTPRFFRTGVGFSGPTGFVDLAAQSGRWSFESYLVSALVDGDERALVLGASDPRDYQQQTHIENRFYTRNFRNREVAWDQPVIEAGFAMERIPLERSRETPLPTLHFTAGEGAFDTLRAFAGKVATACGAHLHHPPSYHYCSWYWRSRHYDLKTLENHLAGFRALNLRLDAVQIDDGYEANFGDWLEAREDLWPGGMEVAFSRIREAGYTPGIWVGPFMVGNRSRLAREHPDWLLKGLDGRPLVAWSNPIGNNPSAQGNEEVYRLDSSHPDALDYLVEVFGTLHQWGARCFKTDFLEWGWADSTEVLRHSPGKTSAQYFGEALGAFRGAMGSESFWLGCITYFAPGIGWMDSMRVSSDVGAQWGDQGGTGNDGVGGGTQNSVSETFTCQYFNNIFWQNDPDVLFLRDRFTGLGEHEIETLACYYAISGASVNTSCPIHEVPEHRRKLWAFLEPGPERFTAHAPFFAGTQRLHVLVRAFPELGAWAFLVINPGREAACERYTVADLIGREKAFCFDWSYRGHRALGEHVALFCRLGGHGHRLVYLSETDAPPPDDLTLGGKRAG